MTGSAARTAQATAVAACPSDVRERSDRAGRTGRGDRTRRNGVARSGVPDALVRAWVEASCREQGVAAVIADPETIAAVVAVLTGRPPGGANAGRRRRAGRAA